ncbi:unnamed protein product [Phytophthora fragariaefolia]|uniref:Unnamed protein product n=1 Tax=Phytophthora fragariaefolia TaxID=1490495 RepID=A0A9W6U272_9STRA|nr:unnamed protein product [Phytophthora fragariaefolia]
MVQEVLQSCHDSLEGGHQGIVRTFHRVKADYYWIGLYADVEKHVRSCPDCSSSKSRPQLRGYSPGNILAERSLQIVSMDFVIPLPKSRRGNTALLLFQCAFTGFVMTKAMSDTSALCVAQAFEECQEIALKMAKEYQAVEKARRANEHNDSLSRQEKASLPRPRVNENSEDNPEDAEDTSTPVDESPESLFERICTWKESNQVSLRNWHIVGMDPSELKGRLWNMRMKWSSRIEVDIDSTHVSAEGSESVRRPTEGSVDPRAH